MNQSRKRARRWDKPDLGLAIPKSGTEALDRYLSSFRQINKFQLFVLRMVAHIESTHQKMSELAGTLREILPDEAHEDHRKKEWRGPTEDLKLHRQFFIEILLVRHVENYLNFLSSLLRTVFIARPEVLRSSEKIDLETVFKHSSIDDLVKTVAERKVDSLSYSSFGDLADYFMDKFHLELAQPEQRPIIIDAIESRNISVHNRCVINQRYIQRTERKNLAVGAVRKLWIETLEEFAVTLTASAISVDKSARRALGLKGSRFGKSDSGTLAD